MKLTSASDSEINLEALYQICPSCFTEVKDEKTGELAHKINFSTLRELLGDNAFEGADEEYGFNWVGKNAARREAARVITKTFRPCPEESVDWENTQNLYIEGDNLEVLKLLQKSYLGKIKMIYIDPPYNTGNDFVYRDDYALGVEEYDLQSGNVNDLGVRFRKNTESEAKGRFHSNWCSMIYERLLVARTMLAEDGAIFISIDDNEQENLKKICDEVFGARNFVAQLVWEKKKKGAFLSKNYINMKEYILVYAKHSVSFNGLIGEITNDEEIENVVVDLSCNGGGAADAAVYVIAWMLGSCDLSFCDSVTQSLATTSLSLKSTRLLLNSPRTAPLLRSSRSTSPAETDL